MEGDRTSMGARQSADEFNLERLAAWLGPLASPVRLRLLRFLSRPHYLEEVASHLGISRQGARKHLDKLVEIGVLERRSGVRDTGPVTEYVLDPQALFIIYDEFEKLGSLRRDDDRDARARTLPGGGRAGNSAPAGPCLTVVRGLNTGSRHALDKDNGREWTLGRDERCQVVVAHDAYASSRHAEVRCDGRSFVLADLGSTNGTLHNWKPLPSGAEVPLKHGDVVGIGKTLLLFWER